ncbi:spermidine synthase [Marinimicrobium agarilyticum]|uniref:spermidine synthase n=1 Tax=Marinimicrobium agarilyticum TaxID=306546 RepID=UPI0003F8D3DE|nr:spermidine synthase [Marinimicrobium agarilyticum]
MARLFEEIDTQNSPIGEISLRRRRIPAIGERDIYEVKLGEEFLMSSLFVAAEEALADLALARLARESLNVVVGGLGLGYTAVAALRDARLERLSIVEYLEPVIRWHQEVKIPLGATLNADPRCHFRQGNFFDLAATPSGLDPQRGQVDAVLLDIDHSPEAFLHGDNASFYTQNGLSALAQQLSPGGVFALWSTDAPDPAFSALLAQVFTDVRADVVRFFNPFQNNEAINTVYSGLSSP